MDDRDRYNRASARPAASQPPGGGVPPQMGDAVDDPMLARIQREAGVPDLVEVLAERLEPTDLQSLLLEVYRRRAARLSPAALLERYERDRFVRPADVSLQVLADFDRLAWSLLPEGYDAIELSPVCPLGTVSAVATVDQRKVVATARNTEVVADATNVLALECASRRRRLLRADPRSRARVLLCASHRLLRAQAYRSSTARAHCRLLGLCAAGRDEGSFRFEAAALLEQLRFYVRLLRESPQLGYRAGRVRVAVTDLEGGRREPALEEGVLAPLRAAEPGLTCAFDPNRPDGRGYYVGACFRVYAANEAGIELELADGGFTTWTQRLLGNAKERLLISGLGTELVCARFRAGTPPGAER